MFGPKYEAVPLTGESVRSLIKLLFSVATLLAWLSVPLSAREPTYGPQPLKPSTKTPATLIGTVEMPFTCGFQRDRLFVTPERTKKTYSVQAGRAQQPFTHCLSSGNRGCATIMVHRFEMVCDGKPVPWLKVVAAAHAGRGGRAWIEDGRLHIKRRSRAAGSNKTAVAILPAGFAPLGHLSARLDVKDSPVAITEVAKARPAASPLTATPAAAGASTLKATAATIRPDMRAVNKAPPSPPATRPEPAPVVLETIDNYHDERLGTWTTTVVSAVSSDRSTTAKKAALTPSAPSSMLLAWGALTVMLVASAWFAIRVRPQFAARLGNQFAPGLVSMPLGWVSRASNSVRAAWDGVQAKVRRNAAGVSADAEQENVVNGIAAVETLCEKTQGMIRMVAGAPSLQEVLESELKGIRNRLAGIRHLPPADGPGRKRASQAMRVMVRDLERIGRIADSAARSMTAGPTTINMPTTQGEAYDVLGINAGVSENVLKKVVDALRMSWHPDLAEDDQDRAVREDRIKQINIAWELISGNRRAA